MKKITTLLIFIGLLFCNSAFSQLERGTWQLQNPALESFNSIMSFDDGQVSNTIRDMTQYGSRKAYGTYTLKGNRLVIVMDNITYSYNIQWYNRNKFALVNNIVTLIYSQSNSSEDNYLANYQEEHGSYKKPAQAQKELCYTCRGSGRCKVCSGMGKTSNPYTGTRSLCNACGGTGKCWHCYGSGYQ